MEEFDLLGHLHDAESSGLAMQQQSESVQVLLWKKLEINGYLPAAREGHSSVSLDNKVYMFGGIEGSKRVNSIIRLDLLNLTWALVKATGAAPSPRTSHATAQYENFMIIQGGEGLKLQYPESYTEEPLLEFPSSTLDGNPLQRAPSKAVLGQLPGVCPGDTLQGLKMGPSVKVQKVPSQVTLTLDESQNPHQQQVMSCFDDFFAFDLCSDRWYEIKTSLAPLPRKGHTMNVVNLGNSGDALKNCFVVFGGFSTDNLTVSNSILACSVEHVMKYLQRSEKILADGKDIADYEQQAGQGKPKRAFNPNYDLQPVVWRTLPAKGTSPPGRFRHTSTVVKDNSGADLLVIIGGIGANQAQALNDVHILQCDTLTWIKLDSHGDGPTTGISLDGPYAGIYGHVSFPYSMHNHTSLLDNAETQGDEHKEIIVFGGSYDTSSAKSSCYPYLFAYNYTKDEWRKVPMSHQYPMSRIGHSFAIASGWTPRFDTPFNPHHQPSHGIATIPVPTFAGHDSKGDSQMGGGPDFTRNSVVVFGGVTSAKAVNDVWALDLYYRTAGLDQYDNNTNQIIQSTMQSFDATNAVQVSMVGFVDELDATGGGGKGGGGSGGPPESAMSTGIMKRNPSRFTNQTNGSSTKTIHALNDHKYLHWHKSSSQTHLVDTSPPSPTNRNRDLKVSQSMPSLFHNGSQASFRIPMNVSNGGPTGFNQSQQYGTGTGGGGPQSGDGGGDEGETIMKFKRERAITEIQLSQERSRNLQLESHVKELEKMNGDLTTHIASSTQKFESEIATLKQLLEESLRRENELKSLNEEANELLLIYGLSRLQHR